MWMSPGNRPSHGTFPARFPATSRISPRHTIRAPNPRSIFPRSRIAVPAQLERQLPLPARCGGHRVPEVSVGGRGGAATGGAAHHEADLEQEGLDHLGERLRLVVDGGRDGLQAHRATLVLLDDRGEEAPVEPVEPDLVDALLVERAAGQLRADDAVA